MKTALKYIGIALVGIIIFCAIIINFADEPNKATPTNTKPSETKVEEPAKKEMPKGKAQTIGAGKFIVGKDVVAGRYKAKHKGICTNFVVYSADKQLKVNCMLGTDKIAESDYTFWAEDGDLIESGGKISLTPVE